MSLVPIRMCVWGLACEMDCFIWCWSIDSFSKLLCTHSMKDATNYFAFVFVNKSHFLHWFSMTFVWVNRLSSLKSMLRNPSLWMAVQPVSSLLNIFNIKKKKQKHTPLWLNNMHFELIHLSFSNKSIEKYSVSNPAFARKKKKKCEIIWYDLMNLFNSWNK